jgi:hypothetical protein
MRKNMMKMKVNPMKYKIGMVGLGVILCSTWQIMVFLWWAMIGIPAKSNPLGRTPRKNGS